MGSLRAGDNTNNFCVARAEKQPYRDSVSDNLVTLTTYKHYHLSVTCIQAAQPSSHQKVPHDILYQLSPEQ